MKIANTITAPVLLIVILVMLILFQSVFLKSSTVVIDDTHDGFYYGESLTDYNPENDFIMYNGVKYYPDRILLFMIIAYVCSYLLPMVFYVKAKKINWFRDLKLHLPSVQLIPFSIFMFFVLLLGTLLIDYCFFSISGEVLVFPKIDTGGNIVFNIGVLLSFVFIPAACEEFIFRAVLFAEYENYGIFFSLLITSAAFAMSKFSLQLFCAYFFASIIFFICVKITNSIWIPVIMHMGYNFYNLYIENELMSVLKFEQNRFISLFTLIILFIVFISFSLNSAEDYYYRKAYKNDPSPVKSSDSPSVISNFAKIFLSPSFIIALIIFFVYISITI